MGKTSLYIFFILFTVQIAFAKKGDNKLSEEITEIVKKARKQNKLSDAVKFVNQAIYLSQQSIDDSIIIATYYNKPLIAAILGDFDKTLDYLHEFDSVLALHYHPYYDFRHYTLYAYAYSMKNNYVLGLKYNLKSIEMAKKNHDEKQLADAYNNIGKEYMNLDDKENSFKYLKLADSIYMKINGHGTYVLYNNLSQVAHNFKEAKRYSQKAYQLLDTTNLQDLALFYLIRSDAFQTQEHYKESLIAGRRAYYLAGKIENKLLQNTAMIYMGKNYFYLDNLDSALIYLEKGLQYDKEMLANKMEIARMLSKVYEKKRNYKKAFQYHKTYVQYYDSIKYDEAQAKYSEFNVKYETAEKDKEIALQKLEIARKNKARNNILFGGFSMLLLVTGFFQWYISKHKKKKQEAELELQKEHELNEMRKHFIENIAHEIRTPVTLINGHLELALENINNCNETEKHIKTAMSNSKKVLSDANEILDMLKLEYEKKPPVSEEIALNSFLRLTFFSFESIAKLKNLELVFRWYLKTNVAIKSDKERLEKILNNFISNAIKFSPSGKQIILETTYNNGSLIIGVTDSGPGIPAEEKQKIFDRFYQLTNTSNAGGMGIGLSLAKELANSLGAQVYVESKPYEKTTFYITLKVELIEISAQKAEEKIEKKETKKNKISVNPDNKPLLLIVEDNPEMNAYLKEILSSRFECHTAFDGIEGLQKAQKQKYGVIISDVMMPGIDGFELKKKLNKTKNRKNTPFIFITAKSRLSDRLDGFNLGVDDYITKPFVKEELVTRIMRVLANKQSRDRWAAENPDDIIETGSEGQLLAKIKTVIRQNLHNEHFKVADLAFEVSYSTRQLSRLIKKKTGLTPLQFIQEIRLQKAYSYLSEKQFATISEVRNKVGMPGASNFNKKFFERFGIKPSEVLAL